MKIFYMILIHQIFFQGMFIAKNIFLKKKIRHSIRGKNLEARISILLFAIFIITALSLTFFNSRSGEYKILNQDIATRIGLTLLLFNILISVASLLNLGDSWRVGVIEDQKTELVSTGIYRFTRNPYFITYIIMLFAYTIILQNFLLLCLTIICMIFIQSMILKEEKYLLNVHGEKYIAYKKQVPRYILF